MSCAGNGLLLMDESLQLLPAETLDLSRNKLTKVDNLRHCLNLKHLDLGFNNLRSLSAFNQVSCNIVKLVLRNNALSTLHGIENLKSLEDLDVSYNIISNFSQLEFLVGLPYLGTLWLEGNPLCCARWYRPQAFSYINHPHKFKLDNKEISTREFWKRQIIIARRQKRPASFGFYSPAVYDSKSEGSNRRRKKMTRLALTGGEGESTILYSDQDSTSIDNEVQSREDTILSDEDGEIADLMNKVEQMNKDGPVLWLREFKEWMDHPDENVVDDHTTFIGQESLPTKTGENHTNEILRCAPHSLKASKEESSTNGVESDSPYLDKPTDLEYLDGIGVMGTSGEFLPIRMDPRDECLKSYPHEIRSTLKSAHATVSPLTTIDSISESHSSAPPGSPPQYRKDILKRRQCLEEEFVQFSEDSYSVASSNSYTSSSEDDACSFGPMSHADQSLNENYSNTNKYLEREPFLDMFKDKYYNQGHRSQENGQCSATDCFSNKIDIQHNIDPYQLCSDEDPEIHCGDPESDLLHEKRGKPQTEKKRYQGTR